MHFFFYIFFFDEKRFGWESVRLRYIAGISTSALYCR